jgi:hypothetical protein
MRCRNLSEKKRLALLRDARRRSDHCYLLLLEILLSFFTDE